MQDVSKSRDTRSMEQQDAIHSMKLEQAKGNPVMVPANRKINLGNEPTTLNIEEVRAGREATDYVHVFTRVKHDDPNVKRYNFEDKIIQIHAGEFDTKVKQNYFQSFDLAEIIHDPREGAETLNLQPNKRNVEAPVQARPSHTNVQSQELRAKAQELSAKEKELIAKQIELEVREAKLKENESKLDQVVEIAIKEDTQKSKSK